MKSNLLLSGSTPSKIAEGIMAESRAIQWRVSYLIAVENGNKEPGKRTVNTVRRRIFENCENIAQIKQKHRWQPAFFASIIKALLRQQAKVKMDAALHIRYDKKLVGELLTLRSTPANTFFVLKVLSTLWVNRAQIENIILWKKIQKDD